MLRKIFICFFVVLLMTTLVVPAFASSSSGSGSTVAAACQIDYIQLLDGSNSGAIAVWPNNYGRVGSSLQFDQRNGFDFQLTVDSIFRTNVYPGDSNYLKIFCSSYYFTGDNQLAVKSDQVVFSGVSLSGNVVVVNPGANSYYLSFEYFFDRVGPYSSEVDLDALIRNAIADISSGPLIYIDSLSIELSYYRASSDPDVYLEFLVAKAANTNVFASWFNGQNLPFQTTVENVDMPGLFDWLLQSVNAFLNFEIVPDFSVNQIFYIILVIGILLWFITLLI